jgi:hypothetical protein
VTYINHADSEVRVLPGKKLDTKTDNCDGADTSFFNSQVVPFNSHRRYCCIAGNNRGPDLSAG